MTELCGEQAKSTPAEGAWPHPGWRKSAAHEARGLQTFAVTSTPAATPIADMVEAMLSGGIPVELVVLSVRTAEPGRGVTDPIAEHRRAFDRERKRRASENAPPAESQHARPPSELHQKSSVVAKPFSSNRGTRIPDPDEKWLHSLAENKGVVP